MSQRVCEGSDNGIATLRRHAVGLDGTSWGSCVRRAKGEEGRDAATEGA